MIKVRLSEKREIVLPKSLGETLGLEDGDYVEVDRTDDPLQVQRRTERTPGPLTDLSQIVTSSRPVGSVDVDRVMDKHGYEQSRACPGS